MIVPGLRPTEADNSPQWDGRRRGVYEVWYVVASDPASQTALWIRNTLEAPANGPAHGAAWFAFFDARDPARSFAIHRSAPAESLELSAAPFRTSVLGCELRHDGARGQLAGAGHEARWDLSWPPAPRTLRFLPPFAYRARWVPTLALTPNPSVQVSGTLTADGRTVAYAQARGAQSHVWGRKHAYAWAWHRCDGFVGRPDVVLEGILVRIKRGPLVSPVLSMFVLWMGDERIESVRPLDLVFANRGRWSPGLLEFSGAAGGVRVKGEYRCRPEDQVMAEYRDPDGEACWCANTEIADCRLWVTRGTTTTELQAPRLGHCEFGGRTRDPAVQSMHQEIQ